MKKFNVAVVGATGNVGREILNILASRKFPINQIHAVASSKSIGQKISYGNNKEVEVKALDDFIFKNVDLVLSSPGSKISEKFAPIAAKQGAIIIDNTSFFRMKKNVPLIVPEVNPDDISLYKKEKIIANPNCSTIQMVLALKPIHDLFKITKIVVATYQSTSGAGKSAMDELFHQTLDVYKNKPLLPKKFPKRIAFNLIPHIDQFGDNGNTKEENKMIEETQKILKSEIDIFSTCVRVPVFVGHGESIYLETEKRIDLKKLISKIKKFPGLSLVDKRIDGGYVTPDESAGEDEVFISRMRLGSNDKSLGLWVVADNLRKGAALNTVQIAELLISKYLKK
ncbi:MAG: aspartate-semialdehyde dehydrogenase [Pseudomonadota bacterium]|nr:aspartate-semialdehyde dehydrogenase [Pseudomonadota bacterium]